MKDGTAVEISASLAGHILDMLRDKIRRTEEKIQAARAKMGKAAVPHSIDMEPSVLDPEEQILRMQLELIQRDCNELANAMQMTLAAQNSRSSG